MEILFYFIFLYPAAAAFDTPALNLFSYLSSLVLNSWRRLPVPGPLYIARGRTVVCGEIMLMAC
jgi:hypothetical protein